MIWEGSVRLDVRVEAVPSKRVEVFYNPVMKLNRDITILFLNALDRRLSCADILAGSGVRALRIMKECGLDVVANDVNPEAVKCMRRNARVNKLKLKISNKEANKFLYDSEGFDYIDIDPFGSPNPFLDASVKRIARGGYIGITATDTSALAGSHPKAGLRKYWAMPFRNYCMHETGIRILIRKVQLIGAQYAKALIPVFCHATQHYYRVYFECKKGKANVDRLLGQHKCIEFDKQNIKLKDCGCIGPLWVGRLWHRPLVKRMLAAAEGRARDLLDIIYSESAIPAVGFYEYYEMCSGLKVGVPNRGLLLKALKKKGFNAAPTHFSYRGIRTDATPRLLSESLLRLGSS